MTKTEYIVGIMIKKTKLIMLKFKKNKDNKLSIRT